MVHGYPGAVQATRAGGQVDDARLVFSANPGRSGSGYLAGLLGSSPDIDAGHERLPAMTGPWLRRVNELGSEESRVARRIKVHALEWELSRLPKGVAYADTSLMFVKTFADVVFERFRDGQISVIALRRDPRLVAQSYYLLGHVAAFSPASSGWMVPPTAPHALFHLDPAEARGPFDLILGSLVDTFAREQALRAEHPEARWIDIDLPRLTTKEGADWLFAQLGVASPPAEDLTREPTNTKPVEKGRLGRAVAFEQVDEAFVRFIERFADRPVVSEFVAAHASAMNPHQVAP